jgi:hypothetical protein
MSNYQNSDLTPVEKGIISAAIGIAVVGLIAFIVSTCLFLRKENLDSTLSIDTEKFDHFGSFISGAVGALWSFASVLFFLVALMLQRKDLNMQRDELKLTREEMALTREEIEGQKKQMEKQNETLTLQQFENTFFQLLNAHSSLVNSINTLYYKDFNLSCFSQFRKTLHERFQDYLTSNNGKMPDEVTSEEIYLKLYHNHQESLGRYFTSLYNLIDFIDRSSIKNKKDYTNFVRARLSRDELAILFFNGIFKWGVKFKPLIESYSLLKNYTKFKFSTSLESKYSPKAFDLTLDNPPPTH